jgi:hypothetical protein
MAPRNDVISLRKKSGHCRAGGRQAKSPPGAYPGPFGARHRYYWAAFPVTTSRLRDLTT